MLADNINSLAYTNREQVSFNDQTLKEKKGLFEGFHLFRDLPLSFFSLFFFFSLFGHLIILAFEGLKISQFV